MKKNLAWVVVLLVIVVGIFLLQSKQNTQQTSGTPEGATTTQAQGGQQPSTTGEKTTGGTTLKSAIAITTPAVSSLWKINELHTISWAQPAGVVGGIYLVNATTKQIVGWINSALDPNATSYSWDTRFVNTTRGGALKKEIVTGLYYIKITFDKSNRVDSQSQPITIAYPDQIPETTYTVTIKNYAFSPKSLTVTKGQKITFINNDTVAHSITFTNITPRLLNPGESYVFDTSPLGPSTYTYYCSIHPSMTGTLIVK